MLPPSVMAFCFVCNRFVRNSNINKISEFLDFTFPHSTVRYNISTKGALRRPMTYDNHSSIPSLLSNKYVALKTTSRELRCSKMHLYALRWSSQTFDILFSMIIDLKRSIDPRWLFVHWCYIHLRWSFNSSSPPWNEPISEVKIIFKSNSTT